MRNGAADEIRTHDIQLGKLTLYQLSYGRVRAGKVARGVGTGKRVVAGWRGVGAPG
jgi:hypothetical protein